MENILVSACLLGENCKYNGGNNFNEKVALLKEKYNIIHICPESDGGLPTPRIPSEIQGNRVVNKEGLDVTKEYNKGALIALELAKKHNCRIAVLKEKSPSCGSKFIYDGSFTGTKIASSGVTTKLLRDNGLLVYSEDEVDKLLNN